jgi:hypothetical protein
LPLEPGSANIGQLETVWLSEVIFRESLDFDPDDAGACRYSLRRDSEIEQCAEDGMWLLHLRVEVEWTRHDEDEGVLPFELEIQVSGAFAWDVPTVERDFVEGWLEFNGPYLLWPYVRTYISSITNLSRLPPLTIYTMTVPRPRGIDATEGQMRLDPVDPHATP